MKRQMIAAILGMAMVMGSAGMAMADTPAENDTGVTALKASVCYTAAAGGDGQGEDEKPQVEMSVVVNANRPGGASEGLPVCRVGEITSDEDGVRTMKVVSGALDKEDFTEVLSALETGEEERAKMLEAYDAFMAAQEEIDELYAGLGEAGEAERERLFDEAAKLEEKLVNPVSDEMIGKALELGLVEEHELTLTDAVSVEPAAVIPAEKIGE